jgi:hypothetical protein
MYVTISTLHKKVKNLTLTVREFNKRIVRRICHLPTIDSVITWLPKNKELLHNVNYSIVHFFLNQLSLSKFPQRPGCTFRFKTPLS